MGQQSGLQKVGKILLMAYWNFSEYSCGNFTSEDCQSEYNNAINNGNLDYFYHRCATELGSQPLRTRCKLCCKENEPSILKDDFYEEYDGVLRSCAKTDQIDYCYEGVDTEFCICDSELCNSADKFHRNLRTTIIFITTFLYFSYNFQNMFLWLQPIFSGRLYNLSSKFWVLFLSPLDLK